MHEIRSLKPSWMAYRRLKPDFIRVQLTKGEMHAYYVAIVTAFRIALRSGELSGSL
jgi:hypothetical protein